MHQAILDVGNLKKHSLNTSAYVADGYMESLTLPHLRLN